MYLKLSKIMIIVVKVKALKQLVIWKCKPKFLDLHDDVLLSLADSL